MFGAHVKQNIGAFLFSLHVLFLPKALALLFSPLDFNFLELAAYTLIKRNDKQLIAMNFSFWVCIQHI